MNKNYPHLFIDFPILFSLSSLYSPLPHILIKFSISFCVYVFCMPKAKADTKEIFGSYNWCETIVLFRPFRLISLISNTKLFREKENVAKKIIWCFWIYENIFEKNIDLDMTFPYICSIFKYSVVPLWMSWRFTKLNWSLEVTQVPSNQFL